jgi:hypothetical protein
MDDRAKVAAGILDRVRGMMRKRRLIAREAPQPRPSQGAARSTAKLSAPLLGPDKRVVGDVRVVVIAPNDPAEAADVHVRWSRKAFGFWYVKTADVGVVGEAEDADLAAVEMILTAVGWTASGSVPLRSMNRMFPKVRRSVSDVAR